MMPRSSKRRVCRHTTVQPIEGLESRRLLAAYSFDYFQLASPYQSLSSALTEPDGHIWFTTSAYSSPSLLTVTGSSAIGEINPSTGAVSYYPTPSGRDALSEIISGPGGDLWFIDNSGLGSFNLTTHAITQYPLGIPNVTPGVLTLGPDGNLWFTDPANTAIGVFDPMTASANEFPLPKSTDIPAGIVAGPDGNLWFTVDPKNALIQGLGSAGMVGNINPTTHVFSLFPTKTAAYSITSASDGNLWFTEGGYPSSPAPFMYLLGKVDPQTNVVTEYSGLGDGGLIINASINASDGDLLYGPDVNHIAKMNPATLATTTITAPSLLEEGPLAPGVNGSFLIAGTRNDASGDPSVSVIVIATPIPANQVVLSGYVYLDPTSTGDGGPGLGGKTKNPVQAGQTVFVDLKHDGNLDPGDPVQNTDSYGYYSFTGLAPGTYTVRVVPYPGALATFPAGGTGQAITVAGGALGAVGPLGVLPVSTVMPLSYNLTPFGTANPDVQTAEVDGLYHVILGRAPDAAGGAAAVSFLKNGGALDQIVANLFGSEEYDTDAVTAFYHDYLDRAPDPAGQAAAVGYLQGGGSLTGLATILLDSPEFNALFPADATFVQALYGDILGRLPSSNEVAGWLATFTAGATRSQVINGFLTSTEATNNAVGWLYATIYARSPDQGGQSQAYAALKAGLPEESLAKTFLSSAEFVARANATVA